MNPIRNRATSILAFLLLAVMFGVMVSTINTDSLTVDEDPHIGAGYSYLAKRDYRLNPEHPPLMKDLAAFPLLFLNLNFPDTLPDWTDDVNSQWNVGRAFIFGSGNDADRLIFWARIPMVLLTVFLGYFVFRWARERYGNVPALGVLFLYTFSPTIIGHGRLVTTDVAAAFGFFVGTYFYVRYLEFPSWKRLVAAGVALGIALLMKFSVVLLIPTLFIVTILWSLLRATLTYHARDPERDRGPSASFGSLLGRYIGSLLLISLIAGGVIWIVYGYHVLDYPPERQAHDTETILQSFGRRELADPILWLADKPFVRAIGQYFFGFLMVVQRAAGGNTTYFLGNVSSTAWWYYFPVVYLLKEPTALLVAEGVTLVIALGALARFMRTSGRTAGTGERRHTRRIRIIEACDRFFPEIVMGLVIGIYWYSSITSNLNIGIRHVIPTFPFIYLLVGFAFSQWIRVPRDAAYEALTVRRSLRAMNRSFFWYGIRCVGVVVLLLWYGGATLAAYPHFLSYFNGIGGGTPNGYRYVTDSNYDWGQDLKRLQRYVREKGVPQIAVHYFGWAPPEYYLGDFYQPWWVERGRPEGYFAISATARQGNFGIPDPAFVHEIETVITEQARAQDLSISEDLMQLIAMNSDYSRDIALRHFGAISARTRNRGAVLVNRDDVIGVLNERSYYWLRSEIPLERVGNSLFIYYLH
ncbi:MAG: glycosyltransferase family 39 protein [Parcubacteria group bacterium]|nr:glycosyltransferase family 39 protein [Parcubacteria group bacterium]